MLKNETKTLNINLLFVCLFVHRNNSNDLKCSDSATISTPYGIYLDISDLLANQSSIHRSSSASFIHHQQQNRQTKLEPKISSSQLQLFLNACKLLDLALLLPSDILPQFQLHKWAFINTDSFPSISTNIRQPIDWLGGISPFSEPIVLNLATTNTTTASSSTNNVQTDSILSNTTTTNFQSSEPSLLMENNAPKSLSETVSLNSSSTTTTMFDTQSPQSLPANLNTSISSATSTITLNQCNNNETTFVPHVVFINQLLNYLTVNINEIWNEIFQFKFFDFISFSQDSIPVVSKSNATTMTPLLTMSSIESIHDLHPFFASVLSRSNQSTMFTTTTNGQQQQQQHHSNLERQNESSSTSSNNHRRSFVEYRTHSANATINSQQTTSSSGIKQQRRK